MVRLASSITFILIYSALLIGQNIGIGTSDPSEKLEVSGMIYTNEGGIKFPDETVQTTAAYNMPSQTHPVNRGAGFGKFLNADLDGTTDTLGLTKTSIIYEFDFKVERIGPDVVISDITIVKQTDRGSPGFYKFLLNETTAPTMEFNLTRPNSSGELEIYYKIKMTSVAVTSVTPQLRPSLDGHYVNTDRITLFPFTLTLHDIPSGKCYCWNYATESSCACP
jgi:type VI protein secretion system component Hcp